MPVLLVGKNLSITFPKVALFTYIKSVYRIRLFTTAPDLQIGQTMKLFVLYRPMYVSLFSVEGFDSGLHVISYSILISIMIVCLTPESTTLHYIYFQFGPALLREEKRMSLDNQHQKKYLNKMAIKIHYHLKIYTLFDILRYWNQRQQESKPLSV